MMRFFFVIGLFLAIPNFSFGQSIQELERELVSETDQKTKGYIYLELGRKYLAARDFKKAKSNARRSHDLAVKNNYTRQAASSAFLLGNINLRERDSRNAEVWFKTATSYAKASNDADLIIKSVNERSRIATKARDYRDAYRIYQEAFEFFSQKGKSISELEGGYELEKAKLAREKKTLEREKARLTAEIESLTLERNQASTEKDILQRKQDVLVKEKEQVEEKISEKEQLLDSIQTEKLQVEEIAQRKELQIKQLNRASLEQKAALDAARVELAEAELIVKQAELEAEQSRNLRNLLALVSGFIVILAFLYYLRYRSKKRSAKKLEEKNNLIEKERQRSDDLLLNILPKEIAEELKETGTATARKYENATVLFTDFKDFSIVAERLTPEQLVKELDYCFKGFDYIVQQYGLEKIKTIGDAYMCASGLSNRRSLPHDIIQAAIEMQEFMADYKNDRQRKGLPFFEARIGLHTGPVVAGVVGVNKFAYDIWGSTVNVASRMEENCEVGKVNVSERTFQQIKYKFNCIPRGKVEAKNVGMIEMYYVNGSLN